MIPRAHITEWRSKAPWRANEQVEQDLIISRSLVEIFSDPLLSKSLAFRGGTALHKLFLPEAMRYSEDIDLVQTKPAAIGPVFDALRVQLQFLGKPKIVQKDRNNVMTFTVQSTIPPVVPLKVKIEINCREHLPVFLETWKNFKVVSPWFSGECEIRTYSIEELLGSKMRALYQRKKGRDLFDLWYSLTRLSPSIPDTLAAFYKFMNQCNCTVSSREFIRNMEYKLKSKEFRSDTTALLRLGTKFDIDAAWLLVSRDLIGLLS